MSTVLDPRAFRSALGTFATGVTVMTTVSSTHSDITGQRDLKTLMDDIDNVGVETLPAALSKTLVTPADYASNRIHEAYSWLRANNPLGMAEPEGFQTRGREHLRGRHLARSQ